VGVVTNLAECPFVFCGTVNDDPQLIWDANVYEFERCCLLRTLLSNNGRSVAEGGGILRPDLAASLPQVSSDGLTWAFKLRRGIHYGPPLQDVTVTSQDFIRSIERLLSPTPPWLPENYAPYLDSYLGSYLNLAGIIVGAKNYKGRPGQHISGLQAPDDHTLVIHLTRASGNLGYLLSLPDAAPIPPVPDHPDWRLGAAQGHERTYTSYLVSTGPYMIEGAPQLNFSLPPEQQRPASGDAPDSLTLVRNPSWKPADDPLRVASPDRIELVPVADVRTAQTLTRTGVIDFAFNWDAPAKLLQGSDSPTSARDQVSFLSLNVAMPPLDDLHVRRAMSFAIARQPLLRFWNKADQPAAIKTHIGLDDEENNLLLNFDPYHAATGDLKEARREMARSRYDSDHDGRCDAAVCRHMLLWVRSDHPEQVAAARRVAPDLARIGLDLKVHLVGMQRLGAVYGDPSLHVQVLLDQWLKDTASPTTYFAPLFGGSSLPVTGGVNQTRLGSTPKQLKEWGYEIRRVPSVDARIRQCLTLIFQEQTRCYAELDQYLTTEVVPWVPLVSLISNRVTSSRVTSFNFDPAPSNPLPSLDRVVLRPHTAPAALPEHKFPVPPIPNGVYRYTVTRSDLLHVDPKTDPSGIAENTGTVTIYMRDGRFEAIQRANHGIFNPIAVGIYKGDAHHVTFQIQQPTFNAFTVPEATWRFDGHALHLKLHGCGNLNQLDPSGRFCKDVRAPYEAHPWVKVADLP
jgi:peptide/nickel transport system substrate-binding protein